MKKLLGHEKFINNYFSLSHNLNIIIKMQTHNKKNKKIMNNNNNNSQLQIKNKQIKN